MDLDERLAFVFGSTMDAETWELADEYAREALIEAEASSRVEGSSALHETVLHQLLADDPPQVWQTARRLAAEGLSAEQTIAQLVTVFGQTAVVAVQRGGYDEADYMARLDRLPLPDRADVQRAILDVTEHLVIAADDELFPQTLERLGFAADDEVGRAMIETVEEQLVDDGRLTWLTGDRTVHVARLTRGIVLTHVLTRTERELSFLTVSVDLAGFMRVEAPVLDGEPLEPTSFERGHHAWLGPRGWLDRYDEGTILAVRVGDADEVTLEPLPAVPELDADLVAAVRHVYDDAVAEPGTPVPCEELVLGVLADDRDAFTQPQAPLQEICDAAGLELRGSYVAHDEEIWQNASLLERFSRIDQAAGEDEDVAGSALELLAVLDDLVTAGQQGEDAPSRAQVRAALDAITDPQVFALVSGELVHHEPDRARRAATVSQLVAAASRPAHRAAAHLVAALSDEADGDWLAAEQHLELAVEADPRYEPAVDRLAWYVADRGDAVRAARLWRSCPPSDAVERDLEIVERFTDARATSRPDLRRNDRCWCGSGRKYKHCHLGQSETPPLPDRVGWLTRKAGGYIERFAVEAQDEVLSLLDAFEAAAGVESPTDDDPLVVDLVLTEGGWFEEFLADRGHLLPDDEALLAASWLTVERTVYEITAVTPGVGLSLGDLRTGDVLDVREATFSKAAQAGMLICARAVPDGQSHQLVGGVFLVRPGTEAELLDVLDDADPYEIARWVGALSAPPQLRTREDERLVECEIVLTTDDAPGLVDHLNRTYDVEVPGQVWTEHHRLDELEAVLRGTVRLDGDRLTITTNSNERADRILDRLREAAVDVAITTETRVPVDDVSQLGGTARGGLPDLRGLALDDPPELDDDALAGLQEHMEQRWCREPVPALGGLTPQQAAGDPTRREQLERLIDSFEAMPTPPGAFTMRTAELRRRLGL